MLNLSNSTLDNYEIIKEIGKGSYSTVYLVKNYSSKKEFALKKVNIVKLTPKERQNSLKEVNFLSEIKDPNVIGYEESFFDKNANFLYLIMEYAPYGDLAKILQKRKKLKEYYSEKELLNMYLQIASGLKAIHAKQIIHRDLKSANIFITNTSDLILKIGDFNVSKKINYLNLKNTQTGTPYYASPEIWENRPYDFKSDIWSLGCLFYEIASFSTPFKGNNMKELYENILKGNMGPLPKQYSNKILKIIKICLRQDADLRPNINDIKFYIENLKLEEHFKKVFDENIFHVNYNHDNTNNNVGFKRQASYIKPSINLNFESNNNDNSENNDNLKFKKNFITIKQNKNMNVHNSSKKKHKIKLAGLLNINLNLINNNIFNDRIKENNNNNIIYKTDNKKFNNNIFQPDNKYFNVKLKPPPYRRLKIINTVFEEKKIIKEERKDNNYYRDEFSSKFNNIKNPLIQTNGKSSNNNSQSIPEIINSEFQNLQNENKNNIKEKKSIENEIFHKEKNIKINYHYKKEKEKQLFTNEKSDKDILILLKSNKLGNKKKLNNLSTLNLHRNQIPSLNTENNINNKNLLEKKENTNNLYKIKNLTKIKLKPIDPSKRTITPFNDNHKKMESINIKNKLKYNFSNIKFRSVNSNINILNNVNIANNEDKKFLNKQKSDKKLFFRKLKFDKNKINLGNNLSPIKTKFTSFIKPQLKYLETIKLKTKV